MPASDQPGQQRHMRQAAKETPPSCFRAGQSSTHGHQPRSSIGINQTILGAVSRQSREMRLACLPAPRLAASAACRPSRRPSQVMCSTTKAVLAPRTRDGASSEGSPCIGAGCTVAGALAAARARGSTLPSLLIQPTRNAFNTRTVQPRWNSWRSCLQQRPPPASPSTRSRRSVGGPTHTLPSCSSTRRSSRRGRRASSRWRCRS